MWALKMLMRRFVEKSLTHSDSFLNPKIRKEATIIAFLRDPEINSKTGADIVTQNKRLCCYLLYLSKVGHLKHDPILASVSKAEPDL